VSGQEPQPFGTYVLLKALGQGAMGDVQLARPYNPNRGIPTPLVIKRLHGELGTDADFVRRFKHEASIAGSVDDTLYIGMEYVPGWPMSKFLESIIKSGRHASIASVVDMCIGALEGLDALHSAKDIHTGKPLGVVHRDISPKNLMVGDDGVVRLIDLGLGKSNVQDWKTRTGIVMGSVGYMPPEQVTAETVDLRADLYAMGVVLYETIALRNYLKRGPIPQMLRASLNPEWRPPSEFRPDVPKALDGVIKKAVEIEAEDRYPSARSFIDALRQVVPPTKSEGGTAALIRELFGDAQAERNREVMHLLSLPLPEHEDGPEVERTVVFAQRKEVAPLQQRDFMPAASVAYAAVPHFPMDPASITGPDGAPVSPYQTHTLAVRSGVSMSTLLAAVAGTAVLTALLVVGGLRYTSSSDGTVVVEGRKMQPVPSAPIAAPRNLRPTVVGKKAVEPKPEPEPEPEPIPEAVAQKTKKRRPEMAAAPEGRPPPVEPPPPPPKPVRASAIEATAEAVNAASVRISQRANQLANERPDQRTQFKRIAVGASTEARVKDYERAAERLTNLQRELEQLAKGD
jgi:serine/threonine-protein kinase